MFLDNGNDSLDFSGSEVDIHDNIIRNSGDKCISVGERTNASIHRNLLSGCAIGVQTKDASTADIFENVIQDSTISGLDAYVKKDFFGEPSVEYRDNYFAGDSSNVTGLVPSSGFEQGENQTSIPVGPDFEWIQQLLTRDEG